MQKAICRQMFVDCRDAIDYGCGPTDGARRPSTISWVQAVYMVRTAQT